MATQFAGDLGPSFSGRLAKEHRYRKQAGFFFAAPTTHHRSIKVTRWHVPVIRVWSEEGHKSRRAKTDSSRNFIMLSCSIDIIVYLCIVEVIVR